MTDERVAAQLLGQLLDRVGPDQRASLMPTDDEQFLPASHDNA